MASGEQANKRHLIGRHSNAKTNWACVCNATIEEHGISCTATCQVATLYKSSVDIMVNYTATIVAIPVSYVNVVNKRFAAIPCKNDRLIIKPRRRKVMYDLCGHTAMHARAREKKNT